MAAATFCLASNAEDGSLLWLDMQRMTHTERIKTNDNSAVAKNAVNELTAYWHGGDVTLKKDGKMPDNDGFAIEKAAKNGEIIAGNRIENSSV